MREVRYSNKQAIAILREQEAGWAVAGNCGNFGAGNAIFVTPALRQIKQA